MNNEEYYYVTKKFPYISKSTNISNYHLIDPHEYLSVNQLIKIHKHNKQVCSSKEYPIKINYEVNNKNDYFDFLRSDIFHSKAIFKRQNNSLKQNKQKKINHSKIESISKSEIDNQNLIIHIPSIQTISSQQNPKDTSNNLIYSKNNNQSQIKNSFKISSISRKKQKNDFNETNVKNFFKTNDNWYKTNNECNKYTTLSKQMQVDLNNLKELKTIKNKVDDNVLNISELHNDYKSIKEIFSSIPSLERDYHMNMIKIKTYYKQKDIRNRTNNDKGKNNFLCL